MTTRRYRKASPEIAAADEAAVEAELELAILRSLDESKPLRAAALHYTASRKAHGVDHPATADAEHNLYRQATALVLAAINAGIARK